MFGVGLGSKFNPIKASAVVDDGDEEEQINSGHNIIRAQIVEDDIDKNEFTHHIMNEVDEIV
tara:strand:- start:134 stop:319 length:186 start_codon:yes stop_codon:yes gene_type:complete